MMTRHKRFGKRNQWLIGACSAIVFAGILIVVVLFNQPVPKEPLSFPYMFDGDRVAVNSLFQFSGFNPDNKDAEGENIAALEIMNQSEEHLELLKIYVTLDDGTELIFEASDLPSGKKALIFEQDNQSLELDDHCIEIKAESKYEDNSQQMIEGMNIEVEGTEIKITNETENEMSNLLLHCHCLIEDTYFGGLTYTYPITKIQPGDSVTIQADECYLGTADVVRVSQDNGEDNQGK